MATLQVLVLAAIIYLVRTDEVEDTLWTKAYGGIGFESIGSLYNRYNDCGYIISGSTR
ncbi:MAG: hypothetical protein IPK08_23850 [Bacteroidetes bacterium]|nr:hypothetical protein [Bacteroidota bacterium]